MTTIYDVIRRPLVTEKSNYQSNKLHQYSFEVASEATRTLVKDAIETLFDVKVVSVNIMNTAAKRSRRRNRRLAGTGSWHQESDRYPGRGKHPRDL